VRKIILNPTQYKKARRSEHTHWICPKLYPAFCGEMLWDFLSLVFPDLSQFPFQLHLSLSFLSRFFFLKLYSTLLCAHGSGKANWNQALLIVLGSGTKDDWTGLLSLGERKSALQFLGFGPLVATQFPRLWVQLLIWPLGSYREVDSQSSSRVLIFLCLLQRLWQGLYCMHNCNNSTLKREGCIICFY